MRGAISILAAAIGMIVSLSCAPTVIVKKPVAQNRHPNAAKRVQVHRVSFDDQIKNDAFPSVLSQLKGMDDRFMAAVEFGDWLDTVSGDDIDKISVATDAYWNAFAIVPVDNPNVFFTRICLLVQDHDLTRAQYVKVFAAFHCDMENDTNKHVMRLITGGLRTIAARCGRMVDSGKVYYDKGDKDKAALFFKNALTISPKDPVANYQAGLTLMTSNVSKIFGANQTYTDFYKKAIACDPFFEPAYQTESDIAVDMIATLQKINAALNKISTGKFDEKDLLDFAGGCEGINEDELAAYAYDLYLHMKFSKANGFDLSIAEKFSECLRALGAENAAEKILDRYQSYNRQLQK